MSGHTYNVIKTLNIMIVFFISGLMLRTDDIKAAWRHKLGVLFGFVSTLAVTPCLGFAMREISLTPQAYTMGLTLTTAVPQTLGIGISLVRAAWRLGATGGSVRKPEQALVLPRALRPLTPARPTHPRCTLYVQVRSMGGNEGLALLLTTGTNIVGIFTMPPWLQALFSGTGASAGLVSWPQLPPAALACLLPVARLLKGRACAAATHA